MLNWIRSEILGLFQAGLQSQQAQMISFVAGVFILSVVLWVICQELLAMAGKTEAPTP